MKHSKQIGRISPRSNGGWHGAEQRARRGPSVRDERRVTHWPGHRKRRLVALLHPRKQPRPVGRSPRARSRRQTAQNQAAPRTTMREEMSPDSHRLERSHIPTEIGHVGRQHLVDNEDSHKNKHPMISRTEDDPVARLVCWYLRSSALACS